MRQTKKPIAAAMIFSFALLAACASNGAQSAKAAPEKTLAPPSAREIADAGIPPTEDQCGASKWRSLVGKSRGAIPQTPTGANWRVTCTSCAVTMDYRPDRLNIRFDEKSGTIEEVKCG